MYSWFYRYRFILILVYTVLFGVGCSGDIKSDITKSLSNLVNKDTEAPFIKIMGNAQVVVAKGQVTLPIKINTNVDWLVQKNAKWVTLSITEGHSGENVINLLVSENTALSARSTKVTFVSLSGDIETQFLIKQSTSLFEISYDASAMSKEEGSTKNIILTGDVKWDATIKSASWLSLSKTSSSEFSTSSTYYELVAKALTENNTNISRVATLSFSNPRSIHPQEIDIIQEGYVFRISSNNILLPSAVNESISLNIEGNTEWLLEKSLGDNWYTVSSSSGSLRECQNENSTPKECQTRLQITVTQANTFNRSRFGKLIFKLSLDNRPTQEVNITQISGLQNTFNFINKSAPGFTIIDSNATFAHINFEGNTSWTLSKPVTDTWYSLETTTGTISTDSNELVKINILEPNNRTYVRSSPITFTLNNNIKRTFIIIQNAVVDTNHDGLIEVSTIEDLNNIRYNLQGSGKKQFIDTINLHSEFIGANEGCPTVDKPAWIHKTTGITVVTEPTSANIQNYTRYEKCYGYILTQNLDFTSNDSYRNQNVCLDRITYSERTCEYNFKDVISAHWLPIGSFLTPFKAVFNGNGKTISKLRSHNSLQLYVGLFGYVDGSNTMIYDLTLREPEVGVLAHEVGYLKYKSIGLLVGFLNNAIMMNNKIIDGYMVLNNIWHPNIGALVGTNNGGKILNSSTMNIKIYGRQEIVSYAIESYKSLLTERTAINIIPGYTGGLVGYNNGEIFNSYVQDTSLCGYFNVGGFVGYNDSLGSIKYSSAEGKILTTNYDLEDYYSVPYNVLKNKVCNKAQKNDTNRHVSDIPTSSIAGGFVAINTGNIQNSLTNISIYGSHEAVGGFVGLAQGSSIIEKSYAKIEEFYIYHSITKLGGFVGSLRQDSRIKNSYTTTGYILYSPDFLSYYYGPINRNVGAFIGELLLSNNAKYGADVEKSFYRTGIFDHISRHSNVAGIGVINKESRVQNADKTLTSLTGYSIEDFTAIDDENNLIRPTLGNSFFYSINNGSKHIPYLFKETKDITKSNIENLLPNQVLLENP